MKGTFKGIRVTKRGVSPRIMTAEVVGSRGTTKTDGPTLRARLGLYDTWASFTAISGSEGAGRRRVRRRRRPTLVRLTSMRGPWARCAGP